MPVPPSFFRTNYTPTAQEVLDTNRSVNIKEENVQGVGGWGRGRAHARMELSTRLETTTTAATRSRVSGEYLVCAENIILAVATRSHVCTAVAARHAAFASSNS